MHGHSTTRDLVRLSWPIIGLNTLNVLALVVDTAMCGRLPNAPLALTALGFATQMVFLLIVVMQGLTVGTVAIVARAHGGRDKDRVAHVLAQSIMFTLLIGTATGAVANLFGRQILLLLGADDESAQLGLKYLRPILAATPFYYLTMLLAGVLRGIGNTRLPFLVSLVANALNVLLNYGLILGNFGLPALGVAGAAYGTVTSQVFSVTALVTLIYLNKVPHLRLSLKPARLDWQLARSMFRVGAPASLDMVILNASFLSIVGMLGRIDTLAVAAHGIGLRLQALAFVPGMSVSQATGAMVGQFLGASDVDGAKRVTRISVFLTSGLMSALGLVLFVFQAPILALFDVPLGSPLGELTATWMELLGAAFPIVGAYVAFTGTLQGAGETNLSLSINAISTLLFQIPLSYLLGFTFGLGVFGVWVAFPLAFIVKLALGIWVYQRGNWARAGAQV